MIHKNQPVAKNLWVIKATEKKISFLTINSVNLVMNFGTLRKSNIKEDQKCWLKTCESSL